MRGVADVAEYRCTVTTDGAMNSLKIELEPASDRAARSLRERVSRAIQDRFHFRAQVDVVSRGSLPRLEMKARRWLRT